MMKEDKSIDKRSDLLESWKNANSIPALILTLTVFVALPLAFRDLYFDILAIKYWIYCGTVISMAIVLLIIALTFIRKDGTENNYGTIKTVLRGFTIKSFKITDWAMILFVASAVISTFQSEYFYESFWGNEGRYSGLFLILLYYQLFYNHQMLKVQAVVSGCICSSWYTNMSSRYTPLLQTGSHWL